MAPPRIGLAGRLFIAQVLVVLAGAVTAVLVAVAVGPAIFHEHLQRVAGHVSGEASRHVEEAYASASGVSLGVALLAALAAALAVSAYVARRVARPIGQLAQVAADVTEGRYEAHARAAGFGGELETVAGAFNTMSDRLRDVETTRRRLLADLGHEMRTPVATIEAYLEAAEDGLAVDDEDTLAVLRTQASRLRRLAEDLAAISSAEEHRLDLHPVRLAPAELVHLAVAAARPGYQAKGVSLVDRVSPELPDIDADPDRIGQALGNLLDNALRHTPPGGRVTVSLEPDPAGVRLTVSDTGEGIPAVHLPHIFERFYRADEARDRSRGGSGIGLAIVRALVHGHGGRVSATSGGEGAGAAFMLTLPAAVGDPPRGR